MNSKLLLTLITVGTLTLASCVTKSDIQIADEINVRIKTSGIGGISAEAKDSGVLITAGELNFAADSAVLVEDSIAKLDTLTEFLRGMEGRKVLFEGHTTNVGDEDSQIALSKQRAQAVADHFVETKALKASMILVEGKGGTMPVGDNETEEGKARNRRVEITVLK